MFKGIVFNEIFTIVPNIKDEENFYQDAIIIWLDDTVGASTETEWFNITSKLRKIIHHLEVYTNINECIEFISSIAIEKVFLIVSGTYGDDFDMKIFQGIINDVFIYVLMTEKIKCNDNHQNIRGCFDNSKLLFDKIYEDSTIIRATTMPNINRLRMNTGESTTRSVNPELIKFKYLQFAHTIIDRMGCLAIGQVNSSTNQTDSNNNALQNHEQFQIIFVSENVIQTGSGMRMITTDSSDEIDVTNQLYQLYCKQRVQETFSFVVYSQESLSIDQLEKLKLNVNQFISNNRSWLGEKNCFATGIFASNKATKDEITVMFEISLRQYTTAFKSAADESHLITWHLTEMVLFTPFNIFRVDSCELFADTFWICRLTLCDKSSLPVLDSSAYFDTTILQLLNILPQLSSKTDKVNDRMLRRCRQYYKDDPKELTKIDDFESSYRSNSAIRWYTKDTFLYRLLNSALRHGSIDAIVDFQYFIIDLYEQLRTVHIDYIRNSKESNLTVYRGQKMSLLELQRLKHNVGKHISINPFFSTTLSSEVALIYAELNESDRKLFFQSALFEIEININELSASSKNYVFANIMNRSNCCDEQEILFTLGSRFKIKSVIKHNDELWVVHLYLLSQDHNDNIELNIMNQHLIPYMKYLNDIMENIYRYETSTKREKIPLTNN
ncbi:unnamed protein product [Adineta steineri]|uniref:Uncharacterized protein n=1 Tax=Adineta steineri TaxID=433720 RepID=A0A815N006_9BILA|nr:unnamed protein product [Adineta steineri]CAF4083931.1 unnamed protein product [Adineta steineri]